MGFTDEELKKLKRELNQRTENIAVWVPCLQALLHRLECAEKVVRLTESGLGGFVMSDAILAWKKSKGE